MSTNKGIAVMMELENFQAKIKQIMDTKHDQDTKHILLHVAYRVFRTEVFHILAQPLKPYKCETGNTTSS